MVSETLVFMLFVMGVPLGVIVLGMIPALFLHYRHEARKLEFSHQERLKALDCGQVLPDAEIARANAESSRARAAGTIGVLVPLAAIAGAAGISVLILDHEATGHYPWLHPTAGMLLIVWLTSGLVCVVATTMSLVALLRRGRPTAGKEAPPIADALPAEGRAAITSKRSSTL